MTGRDRLDLSPESGARVAFRTSLQRVMRSLRRLEGSGIALLPGIRQLVRGAVTLARPSDGIVDIDGHCVELPLDDHGLTHSVVLCGDIEDRERAFLREVIRPGMVVADVGANIGVHTLEMARAVGAEGTVYAFEPDPVTFVLLQRNVKRNGYSARTVFVPKAVSGQTGKALMTVLAERRDQNRLVESGAEHHKCIEVATVRLDDSGPAHQNFAFANTWTR